jgi:N-methylhydantoinase B
VLQVRSDRRRFQPYGLYGGRAGKPSWNWLDAEGERRELPSKFCTTIRCGQLFRHEVAGAGGFGDPLERDPMAVARDVRNEVVSVAAARADYGVIVEARSFEVDRAGTERLRDEMRTARGWTKPPAVSRE